MNRKILSVVLLCFLVTALVSKIFLYDNGYSNPLHFSSYYDSGYYEIHPGTILESLSQKKNDLFTPASEEIWNRDEPHYEVITWSQSDYLKVADALSREVWHEPLDLKEWKVLYLDLEQDCVDNPLGFYEFSIVYFQNSGIGFWSREYQTRLIEVYTWRGLIRWGEASFSDALLPGWGNADVYNFKVTADNALFVADNNGGSKVRQKAHNACWIAVWVNNYPPVNGYSNNDWLVDYRMVDFSIRIDPFSSKFRDE